MATMVKVFTKNEKSKIEFTEKELQTLLDEVYNRGFSDGKYNYNYTWTSPGISYLGNDNITITCNGEERPSNIAGTTTVTL